MLHEQPVQAAPDMTAGKTILLVEDDADIAQLIMDLISQETPYFVMVTDSRGAEKVVQHIKPDLLLLDYLLPDTTGIALYDRLLANRKIATIPAVIMSAALDACRDDLETRHLVGLSKPFEVEDLLSLVRTMLA